MPVDLTRAWVLAGLALVFGGACAYVPPGSCALSCNPDTLACPDGFECQPATQRCVRSGESALCPLTRPPEPALGLPALMPLPPASADAPPAEPIGGQPAAAPALTVQRITLAAPADAAATLCTAAQLTLRLVASGGAGSYDWQVTAAPEGLAIEHGTGSELTLSGTPLTAGPVEILVTDGAGSAALFQEHVYQRPRVLTAALPGVCPEEVYSVPLAASGGAPESYQWSAQVSGALAATATLQELGLALDGALLSGIFVAPRGAAPLTIGIQVRDAHCASAAATLGLEVLPAGTATCPLLRVKDSGLRDVQELPAPCAGSWYREALWLDGGTPDVRWQSVSAPEWLSFDPAQQLLSGVASEPGELVVRVSNAERTLQHRFRLSPRQACWFGWVNGAVAPARLELVDARRVANRPLGYEASDARRSFPIEGTASGVTDFQFSPDGRFIAYRVAEDDESRRLVLLDVLTQQERALFTQVSGYSWSHTSRALAALTGPAGAPQLEMARLAEGQPLAASLASPEPALQLSAVSLAGRPSSLPVWFGTSGLALLEADLELPIVRPAHLQLEQGTASFVLLDEAYQANTLLRGGPGGFFLVAPFVRFYVPGRERVSHDEVIIAPSGRFVARAREGTLRVFHAYQSASNDAASDGATASGCSRLLAWAPERERIACYSDQASQIVVYDLLEGSAGRLQLSVAGNIEGPYLYSTTVPSGRRRLFSRTGQWFAFSTLEGVYVASLDSTSPAALTPPWRAAPLAGTVPQPSSAPPELTFSPDERSLLVQLDGAVQRLDLLSTRSLLLASQLDPAPACSEDLRDTASGWCGTPGLSPRLAWSPGSDLVLTRAPAGLLHLYDTDQGGDRLSLDPACGTACTDQNSYGFQP